MSVVYKNKIVQAFRDNAIKSALFIDDEYLPYEDLVKSQTEFNNFLESIAKKLALKSEKEPSSEALLQEILENNQQIKRSTTAADFVEFFHNKKLICDVENQTDNLDKDKVRKSDLIILDYHLLNTAITDNPAELSLKLVRELSNSKHMNMVVIYTKEELSKVWLELAATLRGSPDRDVSIFLEDQELISQWNSYCEDWLEEWRLIASVPNQVKFLINELDINEIVSELQQACSEKGYEEPNKRHVEWLLEEDIRNYNKNNFQPSASEIHGSKELWLQAGDVFIVLCSKTQLTAESETRDTTPEEVWQQVETALFDWYPSFYRVVTSELQNQIEDANLSMEKVLSKGHVEQIAYLWGVLRVNTDSRNNSSKDLINSLMEDVVNKIQSDEGLINFVNETAENIKSPMPSYGETDPTRNKDYLQEIISVGHENQKALYGEVDKEFRCSVVHAYNMQISIEKEWPKFISTGVLVKDIDIEGDYYVCIAPSCNTVPNQMTGLVVERMTPHRPMRFIKLKEKKIADSLEKAHQSDIIFIRDSEKRLALSVFEKGALPTIVQGVIIDHDTNYIDSEGHKEVQFLETHIETKQLITVTKKLKPLAKLKPGFASRYQNTQFLYESRIGVDLVSANMK